MIYSKGISWFNDCSIPFVDENINFDMKANRNKRIDFFKGIKNEYRNTEYKQQGRFPPNLLVCDDMLNDGSRYYDLDSWFDNLLENYIY